MKREFKEGQWVKFQTGTKCFRAIVLDSRAEDYVRVAYKNLDGVWVTYADRASLTPEPPECDSWDWKPYEERQAEWVKQHGIKVGSRVRVTRLAKEGEAGWENTWMSEMTDAVGTIDVIDFISTEDIHLNRGYGYPYFVLEPVTEPEYRTPTDEDACKRIEVEVRDSEDQLWRKVTLIGVLEGHGYPFFGKLPGGSYCAWKYCRVKVT